MPSAVIAHLFPKYKNKRNIRGPTIFSKKINFDGSPARHIQGRLPIQYICRNIYVFPREKLPHIWLCNACNPFQIYYIFKKTFSTSLMEYSTRIQRTRVSVIWYELGPSTTPIPVRNGSPCLATPCMYCTVLYCTVQLAYTRLGGGGGWPQIIRQHRISGTLTLRYPQSTFLIHSLNFILLTEHSLVWCRLSSRCCASAVAKLTIVSFPRRLFFQLQNQAEFWQQFASNVLATLSPFSKGLH